MKIRTHFLFTQFVHNFFAFLSNFQKKPRLLFILLIFVGTSARAQLTVTSRSPVRNTNIATPAGNIVLNFNGNFPVGTAGDLRVFSAESGGRKTGAASSGGSNILTFNPATNFKPGELVNVTVPSSILGAGKKEVYQFRAAARSGPGTFQLNSTFTVGAGPLSLAPGDVDGDGDLDIVSSTYGASSASLRLNNGSGSFSGNIEIPLGSQPQAVKLADLDGDGDLDLISANRDNLATAVSVRFNNGTGTFGGGLDYAMSGIGYDVTLGDVDGDGDLDLAASLANMVSIRLNDGNGHFSGGSDFISLNNAQVVLSDMDSDGDLDVAFATQASKLIVRFNDGSGVFSGTAEYASTNYHVTAGDVDGDGDIDLLTSGQGIGGILLFRNNGIGSLSSNTLNTALDNAFSATLADIDGDGDLDVLSGSFENKNALQVLKNDGTGAFGAGTRYGNRGLTVATGDMDNDGDIDVLHGDFNGSSGTTVSVLLSIEAPVITAFTPISTVAGANVTITGTGFSTTPTNNVVFFGATQATVSGANTSGTSLIVTVPAGATHAPITVLNTGTHLGAYSPKLFLPVFSPGKASISPADLGPRITLPAGTQPRFVAIADLNADSKPELIVVNQGSRFISVFKSSGAAGTLVFDTKIDFLVGLLPLSIKIADIDGDGRPDLVVANGGSVSASVLLNTSTAGSISFAPRADFPVTASHVGMGIGDLDGDGKPDLVVPNNNMDILTILRNTSSPGVASFAPPITLTAGNYPALVEVNDLDGDGKADLAVTNSNSNDLSIFRNTSTPGLITFGAPINLATGTTPYGLSSGDLNGDGRIDLAVANTGSATISVFVNTSLPGVMAFAGKADFATAVDPFSVAIADINGDGRPELVSANRSSDNISVLRNTGTLASFPRLDFVTGSNPQGLAMGDLDADGRPEVVVTDYQANTISVFRNNAFPLDITGVSPPKNEQNAPRASNVVATFNKPLTTDAASLGAIKVFSNQRGGLLSAGGGLATINTNTLTFNPTTDFKPGETIRATITKAVNSNGDNPVRAQVFQFTAAASTGPGTFLAGSTFAVGAGPAVLATGDVDGDGDLDAIVSSPGSSGASVRLNDGTGNFSGTTLVTGGAGTRQIELADLDGDGDLDMVMANATSAPNPTVSVRFNNGTGIFSGGTNYPLSILALSVTLGDVDGDGDLDLLVGDQAAVWMRLNNGSGSFAAGIAISGGVSSNALLLDIDNDGDLDLAFTQGPTLIVRFNNGDGTFDTTTASYSGRNGGLVAGDVDGDGDIDLINYQYGVAINNLLLFRNAGTGVLTSNVVPIAPASLTQLAFGDIDGDGDLDLLGSDASATSGFIVMRNSGTGTFAASASYGAKGTSLAMGDLDGDGDLDALFSDEAGGSGTTVQVLLNSSADLTNLVLSSGTLSPVFAPATTSYTASVGNATNSITLTPTVSDAAATVTVNGTTVASGSPSAAIPLAVGSNTITTVVTAPNGTTTKTYTVTVTRGASTNVDLVNLVLSSGTLAPVFAPITTSYTASVGNATTSITLTPTASEASATVTVNGTAVTSGSASPAIPLTVGNNTITTIVTASDGTTTKTYTVTVTRASSANADLAGLVLNSGTLSPAFAPATTSYTASVGNATTSITVTPTTSDATATVTVNGTIVASGSPSAAIPLAVGSNAITTVVTAQNGTTKTYNVTVTRAASANADLANLTLSSGTLLPAFAPATTSYTASVGNATTSITVTPTTSDATATVTVNGTTVASGSTSAAIPLAVGSNTITTAVTAQNGTTKIYTVTITRGASANTNLANLTLSSGTLSPAFAPATTSYTASVGNATTSITLTPTVSDATATVRVNGTTVVSGNPSAAIPLAVGSNTITTVVTAPDGTTTKTYTVTVTRATSANADLANLVLSPGTLSPAFAPATTSYAASVGNATTSITLTPTVNDATATVRVNGTTVVSGNPSAAIPLAVGSNTITTVVTAQNGTTKTYTVTVTRAATANADLSALTLSAGALSPAFSPATISYTASVGNATTSITVTPTITDATATVTVNGAAVASGNPSAAIPLVVGTNTITIVVAAQDGTTTKTYTVTVTRAIGTQTITFSPTNTKIYGDAPYDPSATSSNSAIPITYTSSNTAVATVSNGLIQIVGAGTTTITAAQAGNANYAPASADQSLTVQPKMLTITANERSKIYGQSLPSSTTTTTAFTVAGLVGQETVSQVTIGYGAGAPASAVVNTYPGSIVPSAAIGSNGFVNTNYSISYIANNLVVTRAALNITAANRTKIYGDEVVFAGNEFTSTGLVNGNSVSSVTLNSTGVVSTASVTGSPYAIVPSSAVGSGLENYTINYVNGSLTVNRKALLITADNKTRPYGSPNPPLTASYQGLITGENSSVLTTQPTITTFATANSPVGNYPITVSGATSPNYVISYANGILTVTPAAPTDIVLTAETLYENRPLGTLAGLLSSTAVDPSATYTYILVAGSGSTDNAAFSISGNRLLTAQAFNYESKSIYNIRIRTSNNQNQWFEKAFTIVVTDVNEEPTLAAIADRNICANSDQQTVQLSGISTGPESAQTAALTVSATNMNMFDQLTVTMGTGGAATLNYRLKGNASGSNAVMVTVKDNGGTANGGTDTYSRTFTLNVLPLPSLSIVASQGTTISKGTTQTLTASGANSYAWSNAAGIINGQNTSSLTVRPTETTTYTVTGTNISGCTTSQSITINVLVDYNLVANNVLTPNGDGFNDVLFFQNIDVYPINVIKIFDRGGRLLYTKNGYQNEWDGTINGTALTEDTYYYIIELGKGISPKKGFITVIRRK
ncbi:gliding motility-associated-like protein [Pedobacter sp. W3I1]|uniref:cadherin-like beta sandwich domain-containing protein n=1 Tax=Pedobacter sp. W3I1 TaxID=3042291 RepID=UPI002784A4D6|nr:cadherin-like beta sandwich domain-containing protein [Pedobacter sp. W3I1]MDQ0640272.1 gliding motility-associated-like protein [Pedobacter sp. W3I1]